jgi:hypothetical protein
MHDPINNHPKEITFHEYLDNELSSSERGKFENHLNNCQKCAQALSNLKELFTQIENLPPIEFVNDISPSVVEEINRFIKIEPIIKRVAWIQISIVSILIAALFSLISIEFIQTSLSNFINVLGLNIAKSASTVSDSFSTLLNQFPCFGIQFPPLLDLLAKDYLSINFLLAITIISGLLWFIGNKILLLNSLISHSPNGG